MLIAQQVVRWAVTIFLVLVVLPLATEFVIEIARENGLFATPSAKVDAIMSVASSVVSSPWFLVFFGVVLGAALIMWGEYLIRQIELRRTEAQSYADDVAAVTATSETKSAGTVEETEWPKTADYDVPKKLAIIDAALEIIGSEMEFEQAARDGDKLRRAWEKEIAQGQHKEYLGALKHYKDRCKGLAEQIENIRRSNEKYEDIREILYQGDTANFSRSMSHFIQAVEALGENPSGNYKFFIEPFGKPFQDGIREFGSWRFKTEKALLARRKDLSG